MNATVTSTARCVFSGNNWQPPTASYVRRGQLVQSALCARADLNLLVSLRDLYRDRESMRG